MRVPQVEAELQAEAVRRTRGGVQQEAVVHLRLAAVVLRERDVVVLLAEFVRVHVVKAGDRVAGGRQARIVRHDHAERAEVGGRDRQVVRDREVHEPAAVIADLHRNPRQHLLLDGGAELPVAGTHAPAPEHGRVVACRSGSTCRS